jgi:hypothetical protein
MAIGMRLKKLRGIDTGMSGWSARVACNTEIDFAEEIK